MVGQGRTLRSSRRRCLERKHGERLLRWTATQFAFCLDLRWLDRGPSWLASPMETSYSAIGRLSWLEGPGLVPLAEHRASLRVDLVARHKTLSRREQRQVQRQMTAWAERNADITKLAPDKANLIYGFVMAWQPPGDEDNALFREQLAA